MYKRMQSFHMLYIPFIALAFVVFWMTIFGAKLQLPAFGITWSEFTFTPKPKIEVPKEEDIANLNTAYSNLQNSLASTETLKSEIKELHDKTITAIVCSDTNWYFKQLAEKYSQYEEKLLEIEQDISEYEKQYDRYQNLLANIPDYAIALREEKNQEFTESVVPVYELVCSKKEQYMADKDEMYAMYESSQQLADSLYEEYMQWCPGLANAEGGNTPEEEICWILRVVENRIKSSRFPNTLYGVISAPGQYSTFRSGAIYITPPARVRQIVERYLRGEIRVDMPDNVLFQALFVQGPIWKHTSSGEYFCFA